MRKGPEDGSSYCLFFPQLAEIQREVAALREEQKALSNLVESLSTHIQALTEQQEQMRCQLRDLDSRLGAG